jgi:hypothetical protein
VRLDCDFSRRPSVSKTIIGTTAGKSSITLVFMAAPSCSSYVTGERFPIIGGYRGG